jgi:hypothetical protein
LVFISSIVFTGKRNMPDSMKVGGQVMIIFAALSFEA